MKGLQYKKLKDKAANSESWGSYSDLFMVLSFVFLMMYVVASLRSGTSSIYEKLEKQKVARENENLRAQMKAYDTLKEKALHEESQEEQKVYQELMNKLSLLQEEAKDEKLKLRRQAIENEKKEMALNKYQQVIRNIINANLLAKNKLKVREEIIEDKNEKISNLKETVEQKQNEIQKNNLEIASLGKDLEKKIADLTKAQKSSKITKEKAYKQIADLKRQNQQRIENLRRENEIAEQKVAEISEELNKTQLRAHVAETENVKISQDLRETSQKLELTKAEYAEKITQLRSAHNQKIKVEREILEKKLKKANLTAKEKARQLAEFNEKVKRKGQEVAREIGTLQSELAAAKTREEDKARKNEELSKRLASTVDQYQGQIKALEDKHAEKMQREKDLLEGKLKNAKLSAQEKARELSAYNQKLRDKEQKLSQEIGALKGSLAEAQAKANARAKLAREISTALKSAGVKADVNSGTGDVVISFGDDFFDTGSAALKPGMREVLRKFIPKYSEALLKDSNIAEKITSVEIIGFASPTYKNKYIDPNSLAPEDQKAAKYNLDLSFRRASSIYDDIFDTKKIQYTYQKDLLSKVKVSGRSFFSEGRTPAGVTPGMDQRTFCNMVDCKKAQRVIIKFNMDDKVK